MLLNESNLGLNLHLCKVKNSPLVCFVSGVEDIWIAWDEFLTSLEWEQ